jgi:hypothetical protein
MTPEQVRSLVDVLNEGRAAFQDGKPETSNPYMKPPDSNKESHWGEWRRAWRSARDEAKLQEKSQGATKP